VEREGVTVFLNTHNLAEAERLCQQISELRARAGNPQLEITGKGFSPEAIQELRSRPEVLSAELHNNKLTLQLREAVESAPLVSLLVGSGAQVEEVIKAQSSLEDVFLSLVNEDEQYTEGGS
jgi:ABC-2 type transport system ATP-binding protein